MSTAPSDLDDLHVIIPAGGAGTRLWPLSRAGRPKFLLDLTGSGRTLLQQTWDRVTKLVPPERVHVVTGPRHADAVRAQLPGLTSVFVAVHVYHGRRRRRRAGARRRRHPATGRRD